MKKRLLSTGFIVTLVMLISLSLSTAAFAASSASTPQVKASRFKSACSTAKKGEAKCLALVSSAIVASPNVAKSLIAAKAASSVQPLADAPGESAPYAPADLLAAYNLSGTAPSTQTVAIVDAYNDPNAESDLATYRSTFGLSACTTANGCFKKVSQTGSTTSLPSNNASWSEEISLDLDMVSAICQNCHILLVEATSATIANLGTAVNEAVTLGAKEVSNSYGASQSSSDTSSCSSYYNHSGVAVTASSGDSGPIVENPADCPHTVAVGGTSLSSSGTETAWNTSSSEGAGGGCSSYITKPTWQNSTVSGCSKRAVADVAAVADPATGVYVYDSYQVGGWLEFGGTSVSSPIIASVYALAGGVSGDAASVPWNNYSNGCLFTVSGKTYSYQTGLGTPNGTGCF